ncbi:transcriptional regulatory protein ZraR [bacterium BMS3Abin04]|nr:transcriptional regulatory protein ZraR [bacterium BMS3Abin04]
MNAKILVVDDEEAIRTSIQMILNEEGYRTDTASDGQEALDRIKSEDYDIIISDIKMPKWDGIQLLEKVSHFSPESFFIIMTAYASIDTAIGALRKGAIDYFIKPIEFDDLIMKVKRLLDYKRAASENITLRQRISAPVGFENIIGKSKSMHKVFNLIRQVAPTNSNVLISGKSGTGKELVAKAIHYNSKRKNDIFLPINCGAISENLIESELFGHKKGSFTGATEEKTGLFKVADGGTLFLDEIGDLPLALQVKLLRAIEDKQFLPVGGTVHVKTDARIIAATNQNIFEKTKTGEFREDLYYRLNVVEIKLPSLNERKEDIPILVNHFIEKFCYEMGKPNLRIDNKTIRILMNHNWRGGVRELENVIERAVIFATGMVISPDNLADYLICETNENLYPEILKDAVKAFEKEHIIKTVKKYNYDKDATAKALNIGLSSLYRKMEELDIPTKSFDD